VYEGSEKLANVARNYIYSPADGATCGVDLEIGKTYVAIGGKSGSISLHVAIHDVLTGAQPGFF